MAWFMISWEASGSKSTKIYRDDAPITFWENAIWLNSNDVYHYDEVKEIKIIHTPAELQTIVNETLKSKQQQS